MKPEVWHDALNQHKERLQFVGDITLNLDFWDCGCVNNYIHSIRKRVCPICGFYQENCPSSRENEIQDLRNTPSSKRNWLLKI